MESYNAILIEQKVSQSEMLVQLNNMAKSKLRGLGQTSNHLLFDNKDGANYKKSVSNQSKYAIFMKKWQNGIKNGIKQ